MEKSEQALIDFFLRSTTPYAILSIVSDQDHLSKNFKFEQFNTSFAEYFGLHKIDIDGCLFTDLLRQYPNVLELIFNVLEEIDVNHATVERELLVPVIKRWINVIFFPIDSNTIGLIVRDIHEEVLLRNEIDGFMSANLDMLCVINPDAVFLKVNPHFADVMEMDIEDLTNKSFYEFIHPEDIENTKVIMSQLAEGNPIRGFVNRYRKCDGEFLNIEWSATAKEGLIYASGRNITMQIRTSLEIRQTNEELRRLTDKLGETNLHLEKAATTDELTGIYNRHYFEIKVTELMDEADSGNSPLSLIMFDLDHFKRINDTYGHPIGDQILIRTTDICKKNLRTEDLFARFGGEEFVIVLQNSTVLAALKVAEKLREAIYNLNPEMVGRYSCSFGVAERAKSESFTNWYKRADKSLYHAKSSGRNRVSVNNRLNDPFNEVNLTWQFEWNSGNNEIDHQHRILLDGALQLYHYILNDHVDDFIEHDLDKLIEDINGHFNYEISLLQSLGYVDVNRHQELHQALVEKTLRFRKELRNNTVKPEAFFSFLVDNVILVHMVKEDVKFFPLFAQRDLKQEN